MNTNLIGQTLLNQYRVESFVAAGGMSAVYRVWDLKRNVPLAMKVLHGDLADDPAVLRKFQREARALQKLRHPNIVPFYGLHQTREFYFLLEHFVDGYTLKQTLIQRSGKRLPIDESLIYLKALSAALGYAHAEGFVHCDVKPGNILIDRGGNIFLSDFGIARYVDSTTTSLASAGTAAYMAPEQILGRSVTPATDVYAMGVNLFEILTGRRPFRGDESHTLDDDSTVSERIRTAQIKIPPPDPNKINPAIPIAFSQVILKSLEKDPQRRFSDMQSLLIRACSAIGTNPAQVPSRVIAAAPRETMPPIQPATVPPPPPTAPPQSPPPSIPPPSEPARPRKFGISLVLGLGGLLVVILLGFIIFPRVFNPPPPETPFASIVPSEVIAGAPTVEEPTDIVQPELTDTDVPIQSIDAPTFTSEPPTLIPSNTAEPPTATFTPPPPPSDTPPPPVNRVLAYVVGPVGDGDIYVADENGNQRRSVANSRCDESEPAVSRDGRFVAYQKECSGESTDIWVVTTNGSGNTPLTTGPGEEREPSWSANGEQIAFQVTPPDTLRDKNGEIWIMNSNGTGARSLGIVGRSPTWSPDGKYLAYMHYDGNRWQIHTYTFDNREEIQVTRCNEDNCRWPTWSPDGGNLVYNIGIGSGSSPGGIWYVSAATGNRNPIINERGPGRPSWSDSGWIAFSSNRGIEIVRIDGTGRRILIEDSLAWAPSWSR